MDVLATVLNYTWLKYAVLPLWILLMILLLHRDLSRWDGLMGPLSHLGLGENGTASYLSVPSSELVAYDEDSDEMRPASIILIFRNEQLVVLLRTLHSLVDRTPKHLYAELILVDDHSDTDFWDEPLSVTFFDTYKPVGLIKARILACNEAKADNLVFVDAQVEVTKGWLSPLLSTISEQSLTLATPVLDKLDEQTLAYHRSIERRGVYDWMAAVRTSVFAIRALWFQDLSNFDKELQGFGGAELELSFKVWRSGGRIVQVPCSRVGHLEPKDLSYLKRYGDLGKMGQQVSRLLLLLLLMASGSICYYLYTLKLERQRDGNVSSTTSRLEREISDLQAVFESEVIPELGALGRPARGNWTNEELEAIANSQRERARVPAGKAPVGQCGDNVSQRGGQRAAANAEQPEESDAHSAAQGIILVDDGSSQVDEKLNDFLQIKFLNMVKHHRISTQARVFGANRALADVLVFLDAHVEVTHGWLEPLLAPILKDNRTCTTPIIDTIDYENFAYRRGKPSRGFFNWQFDYIQLPLLKEEANPIMNGGLFAIGRQWFADLGGYDKGLKIWGGDQFELSLKLWLCGGQILEVPCSRIGHLYRSANFQIRYTDKDKASERKLIQRNYRRVAEVWLDEFKDKVYANMPHLTVIPTGNLAEQRELRKRLHCKSFKWFLTNLASDFLNLYPVIDPAEYATGVLQSLSTTKLCLERTEVASARPKLGFCSSDRVFPKLEQHWTLTNRRELQSGLVCLEVRNQGEDVYTYHCHRQKGNQFWSFDPKTRQVISGQMKDSRVCLEVQSDGKGVTTGDCDPKNTKQQWKFGYQNNHRLQHFWDNVKTH
ncbi:hypothetical protein M5D96_010574 [Drosophila gunungcola]|uniref:Polypeptide N-acetylgalactosaminyltransferase n=1 Tax=Drosophila gunungcola TaxID=103775 RepID=A0A9P9YHP3_9MUSC|nr:hypothetical protein M5D96_010574 [Drosophila gunungcola]